MKLSALKKYGLLEPEGDNYRVSDRAVRIIHGQEKDRVSALREAAESVDLFKELAATHANASRDALKSRLIVDEGFSEDGAEKFIEAFTATLELAKLGPVSTIQSDVADGRVQVGDCVQWTSQGVDQFPVPKRVVAVDGEWVFVEGERTGVPMNQVAKVEVARQDDQTPPPNPFFVGKQVEEDQDRPGIATERATLDEGPVVLTWPDALSEASVEELEYWLKGIIRRARRKAGMPPA
ncbi:MAG: hypothetical protein KJZ87_18650 [Thermoguttaceae bacterium]|nr:hypothetical protein [Thermoguttaceae bacterium]